MTATVLSKTPVAVYALVFHPSFLLPAGHTTISDHAYVIGNDIAPGISILAIAIGHWIAEGISMILPTDEDNTDTFETNVAEEQSAQERARILVSQLINKHLI